MHHNYYYFSIQYYAILYSEPSTVDGSIVYYNSSGRRTRTDVMVGSREIVLILAQREAVIEVRRATMNRQRLKIAVVVLQLSSKWKIDFGCRHCSIQYQYTFILMHLNYYNSVLYCIVDNLLRRLQSVQNAASFVILVDCAFIKIEFWLCIFVLLFGIISVL